MAAESGTYEGQIEFWFDFSSPYAYFAAAQIENIASRHKRRVEWRPFLLGAAFRVTGMQSLSKTPVRGDYARHDWLRLARKLGIPFALPPSHPVLTVAAGRSFLWLERQHPELAVPFAKKVFDTYFGQGRDVSAEAAVVDLAESCGVPRIDLLSAMASAELKGSFRRRTDEALERGVFGSPFFFIDDEPFWGSDRLPMIDEWLSKGGW